VHAPILALLLAVQPAPAPPQAPEPQPDFATLVEEEDALLAFTYGWPRAAAAVPAVERRMRADMAASRARARKYARDDKAERPGTATYITHYFAKTWATSGNTPHLLTLSASIESFTGGAHGNLNFAGLIWDKAAGRAVTLADLFADAAEAFAALTPAYCHALDQERSERRGEPLPLRRETSVADCPPLPKQVALPVDADGDGRFEALTILLGPYAAGAYAEGSYEVEVPLTAPLRALVKDRYRASF
jgi:hypothetical protein